MYGGWELQPTHPCCTQTGLQYCQFSSRLASLPIADPLPAPDSSRGAGVAARGARCAQRRPRSLPNSSTLPGGLLGALGFRQAGWGRGQPMPRHRAMQSCPFCTPILRFLLAHATAHMTQQMSLPCLAPQCHSEPSLERIEAGCRALWSTHTHTHIFYIIYMYIYSFWNHTPCRAEPGAD